MNYDNYQNYSLPTIRHEDWKYTDLSHLVKQKFSLMKNDTKSNNDAGTDDARRVASYIERFCALNELVVVILNGSYRSDLSRAVDFHITNSKNTKDFYIQEAKGKTIGISDYIHNADHDGIVIDLSDNISKKFSIRLLNIFTKPSQDKIINNKNFIKLGNNVECNLIEEYISISDGTENHLAMNSNVLFEFELSEKSVLNHYVLQSHNEHTYHLSSYVVNQQARSHYNNYNLNFGGKLSRQDIIIYKNGEYTNTALRGLFMPCNKQHMDSHLKIYHNDSHGASLQDYRGVLKDRGHGVWNGMVYVAPGTKANSAIQSNKNLLLSEHAMVDAKPELQIHTDDVSCSHGATIGQLDEKAMFYLQSRGIPASDAKSMLISAFIGHILSSIHHPEVKAWLNQVLESENYMENINV